MPIGGLQKTSLIDYPGKISSVIFIAGCNLKCPYCHNSILIKGGFIPYKKNTIINFLQERINFIEGVVISGGEPTLYKKLEELCLQIKDLGYPIKLDTNGTNPDKIENLLQKKLIDYIAMDIKTAPNLYSPTFQEKAEPEKIIESIKLIKTSRIPYEFRTTCSKKIITADIMEKIARLIAGARLYSLQLFNDKETLNPDFFKNIKKNYGKKDLLNFKAIAEKTVKKCIIR
ncbi:MAG: anaerobic ribonucleoside-triphosphate reductase activating protein [Deltaproteobacteria bacterium]|nr:anaerobic ribonucleoside-triphosphate reductase activating protein [Deltaproteobacteria bacterium]